MIGGGGGGGATREGIPGDPSIEYFSKGILLSYSVGSLI